MAPHAAILESVRTRIRPIFMTALIGLFGLLPLVISPGAGSELYRGLGSVTLGGLIASTVFTLFLVPVSFSLAMDCKAALARLFRLQPVVAVTPSMPTETKPALNLIHADEPTLTGRSLQQEPAS